MAKKIKIEVTEYKLDQLINAIAQAIELDETFYIDGCTRDPEAATYFRSLLMLARQLKHAEDANAM